jgi:hypothetical protein
VFFAHLADFQLHDECLGDEALTDSDWSGISDGAKLECPARFVPVEMRQTGTMKGLEKLYQLEG